MRPILSVEDPHTDSIGGGVRNMRKRPLELLKNLRVSISLVVLYEDIFSS